MGDKELFKNVEEFKLIFDEITTTKFMEREIETQWKQIYKDVLWTPDIGSNKD